MTVKMWRRVVALVAAGASALALLAVTTAEALAAPTMVVNGQLMELGRDGPFRLQNTSSTGTMVGMLAVGAAIVVVAGVAWSLDRQADRRLAAVRDQSPGDERTTIGERQKVAERPGSEQDQERKAA